MRNLHLESQPQATFEEQPASKLSRPSRRPDISVVLPVRNGSRFLSQALDSILGQTVSNIEVICVDDGSTDDTPAILARLDDPRIIIFSEPERGSAGALNRGIQAARSNFIAIMHADDVASSRRLELQLEFLRAHPDVAAVGSSAILIDEAGNPCGRIVVPTAPEEITRRLIVRNLIVHPSVMLRRRALTEVGFYDENAGLAEDYDLWFRLLHGWKLANLAEPLLAYRVHSTALSATRHKRAVVDALRARWRAIRTGLAPAWSAGCLLLPLASLLIPVRWSRGIRAGLHRLRGHRL